MRNQQWRPVKKAFIQVFRRYGLPEIIRVDNGVPFGSVGAQGLSKLSIWWISLGIKVEYTRPGKPQDNGCHERMHKTLKAEAIKPPSPNFRAQQRRFDRWRKEFNEVRPHESLEQTCPADLYHASEKRYCGSDTQVEYNERFKKVFVQENGSIRHNKNSYYIGDAFAGVHVGLLKINRLRTEVYYANIRLGRLIRNKNRKDPFRPPAYLGP
ncbi:integrase core domain-containing protein [Puniceicoccaceae bacterium K14]|nr:integrase core domain-containing protein [Puniceicoccaceae bacterium K14]